MVRIARPVVLCVRQKKRRQVMKKKGKKEIFVVLQKNMYEQKKK